MISLNMIVRNEGRTIYECLKSVLPYVDEVVIGFAGESTDNTGDEVKRAILEHPNIIPRLLDIQWTNNFAEARNHVLDATEGDWVLWLDGDDVLVGGERIQYYMQKFPDADAFYMGYDYARDEEGNNICFLIRERLVRRAHGWRWIGAIHEVLSPASTPVAGQVPDIHVVHNKPPDKHSPTRNLDILYSQLESGEPNPDPRILAYLGSENAGRGNLREAILHWQRFIKISGWDEEKYQTQVKLSDAYRQLGELPKALQNAYWAIEMKPNWPDAYISLARTYMSAPLFKYNIALEWLKVAESKPIPQTMLIVNPQEYRYNLSLLVAACYTQLGDWEMALANFRESLKEKVDPQVVYQIGLLEHEIEEVKVLEAWKFLREYLARHDEWLKVRRLLDVVPHELDRSQEISELRVRTLQQTGHIDDPQVMVDFYRGNPHWTSMPEDQMKQPSWLEYPRMKFALEAANYVDAKSIIDWGCSDGFIALPLARETGATVYGFDLDPRCVDLANDRATAWGVDASFAVGNVDDDHAWHSEPADLALLFEVIEHVVDPAATLDKLEQTAKHIALTTPYLAWENGNIPQWDKLEPKGHLRIFDLKDMEMLLSPRGSIRNLYKQDWGNSGWIFADYTPGVFNSGQNITIGAGLGSELWGPKKYREQGLGGSETAVIRVAEELAKTELVTVYCPVDSEGYYNGARYRDVSEFDPQIRSDMYIAWRMPEAADWDINTGRLILWMHDTDAGDRLTPDRAKRFDNIVVLTEWHKQYFLDRYPFVEPEKLVVIGNGIDLERFSEPVVRDPHKVMYSSSPDRGLDVILEHIWPQVIAQVPDAELHVYYGWDNFNAATMIPGYEWLMQFKNKLQQLFLESKNVVQHGRIPQDRLAKEFQEATIWLYPTYFTETYCITAVEAQLAGAIPVTNHLAGLSETVRSGVIIEGDVYDENTQRKFAQSVIDVLRSPEREKMHQAAKANAPAVPWSDIAHSFLSLEG